MTLKNMLADSQFVRIVLVLWVAISFSILLLLNRIDYVVHHDLYAFGLQFSSVWADTYWATLNLIYVCLAIPSVLSIIAVSPRFWKKFNSDKRVTKRKHVRTGGSIQPLKEKPILISCPSCNKTFSKPLSILDFGTGKAELVNVCPYCNAKLVERKP